MARILIIDDEELVRLTLVQALESSGHVVTEAANGRDGVRQFGAEPYDLVITDILMPDQEGIQTIMELRKLKPDLKIVAISGGGRINTTDFLMVAKRLGADATLKKPFQLAELFRVVDTCLGGTA